MTTERLERVHKERMHQRAKIAALTRSRAVDDPDLVRAKQELAALKIEAAVLNYQADPDNPPMSVEQVERLTRIIVGSK